ncbi:hypothetical protein [Roseobacter ponti]|uniref:Uncharacterized protein n=1 Tax=Roseobacter ponti TaxID=1891787 RepID=A0A858SUD6_9RHOB|nr:hypothetical protein [Roseobacter ponti]QJF52569.1 hypothetical protein G3256_16020 [Roseobacter ponti]
MPQAQVDKLLSFWRLPKTAFALLSLLSLSTAHIAGFVLAGPHDFVLFADTRTLFSLSIQFSIAFVISVIAAQFLSWATLFSVAFFLSELVRWCSFRFRRKVVVLGRQTVFFRRLMFTVFAFFAFSGLYYGSIYFLFASKSFHALILFLVLPSIFWFLLYIQSTPTHEFRNTRRAFGIKFAMLVLPKSDINLVSYSFFATVIWAALAISFLLGTEKFFSRLINTSAFAEVNGRTDRVGIISITTMGYIGFTMPHGQTCHSAANFELLPSSKVDRVYFARESAGVEYCR